MTKFFSASNSANPQNANHPKEKVTEVRSQPSLLDRFLLFVCCDGGRRHKNPSVEMLQLKSSVRNVWNKP